MNAEQIWKPVVGFEGLYSVSSLGHVRSEEKFIKRKSDGGFRCAGKLLSPGAGVKAKYLSLLLTKDGKHTTHYVHHLVLVAFVAPRPDGKEACHGDGNRQNNCVENLRWDTRKANHADKNAHGTSPVGERHPHAKLTDALVQKLRTRRKEGASITTLSNEFSVSRMTASRAASKVSWSHIV